MSPIDRVSGDTADVGNRLDNRGFGGGRLVGAIVARLAEADRRQRVAKRLASRKLARCPKARRTYAAALVARWAAYAVILGLVGVLAWQVEETHRRIARRREAERIEIKRPESDRQSRIASVEMCGIVGDNFDYGR